MKYVLIVLFLVVTVSCKREMLKPIPDGERIMELHCYGCEAEERKTQSTGIYVVYGDTGTSLGFIGAVTEGATHDSLFINKD